MRKIAALLLLTLVPPNAARADEPNSETLANWHQWRGPLANGYAPHADPPLEWSATKNVKWKVAIPGSGDATPVVWDDRIFVLSAVKTDREEETPPEEIGEAPGGNPFRVERPTHYYQFLVLCFDRATGKLLWQQTATEEVPHEGAHPHHGFASASPITDGKHVYAYFGSRGLYCYDMDGQLVWQRDLGAQNIYRFFGEATSPVLNNGVVYINWDHEGDSFLYALDGETGEIRWQVPRDEHTSWATPLVVDRDGHSQLVVNGGTKARGYDLATGEVLWECGGQVLAVIPCPVVHEDLVFCMSGYPGSALFAIPLNAEGDISDSDKIAWSRDRDTPYCPSPVLYDGRLYFNKSNGSVLTCLDAATGEPIIEKQRMPAVRGIYASPVAAAGKIYFTGRNGASVVLDGGREFEVLATNEIDEPVDASIALVGRDLVMRSESHLYCISKP